jgi:hypothetical protein
LNFVIYITLFDGFEGSSRQTREVDIPGKVSHPIATSRPTEPFTERKVRLWERRSVERAIIVNVELFLRQGDNCG